MTPTSIILSILICMCVIKRENGKKRYAVVTVDTAHHARTRARAGCADRRFVSPPRMMALRGWSFRDKSEVNTIMFRASPWITYDPPTSESQHPQSADNDADMDAPQISTLHDDGESPPSNASPARTGKFRVKLPVNEAKMGTKFITFNGKTGEEAAAAEEHEEDEPDEDEEDELIDDEEDASTPAASGSGAAGVSSSSSAPAKSGTKRPSARIKSQARRKARLSGPSAAPSSAAPTTASSEAQSSPAKDVRDAAPSIEPSSAAPQASLAVPAATSKKKAVPKGTTAAQRAPRKSAPK